jgi:pimeloyl-ACP methyl ester carboxylesterase
MQELMGNLDQIRRSWYVFAFQVPGLPEWLIQQNLKNFVQDFFRGQAIRKGAFTAEDTQMYEAALRKPGVLSAAINYHRQLFSLQSLLRQWRRSPDLITVPTLILWGEEDALLSPKLAEGLEQLITAPFKLKFVPHCGHWIQQEAPQTVNRELLSFLQQP